MSFGNKTLVTKIVVSVFATTVVFGALVFSWNTFAASNCTGPSFDSVTKTLSLTCTESTDIHELSCSDATNPDTLRLSVNGSVDTLTCPPDAPPNNAPTVTVTGPTSGDYGVNHTFTITGDDADSHDLTYQVDWENDGDASSVWGPMAVRTPQNMAHSWTASGVQSFQVQAIDSLGLSSGWQNVNITINAAPAPTSVFRVRQNSGSWVTGDLPGLVDTNDTIDLNWSSTADTCTGTGAGFITSNNPNGTVTVTTPDPGQPITFTLDCTGPGGSVYKEIEVTAGLPNFTEPTATDNKSTLDPVTGNYSWMTVSAQTINGGQSGTKNIAEYSMSLDGATPVTGSLGIMTRGADSGLLTKTFNNVSFGDHVVTIIVDSRGGGGGDVAETIETDNTYDYGITVLPPNPELYIRAERSQVQVGDTTRLNWGANAGYAGLTCSVTGPNLAGNPVFTNPTLPGLGTTAGISAKSTFTITCIEPITGTPFSAETTVETVGTLEEV